MTNLVSLALAAEARGIEQRHLDRARAAADEARRELESTALELVQQAMNKRLREARPGDQLALPVFEASYSTRMVDAEHHVDWRRRFRKRT